MKLDTIILGAGVVGLSTARQLLQRGASVTVLDPSVPGGQGSRAAAGVAIPSVRLLGDPEMRAFASASKPFLTRELDELGAKDGGLRRGQGVLRLAADAKGKEQLDRQASEAAEWMGRWVAPDELVALEPAMRGTKALGAYLDEAAHMVDTHAYLNALLADVGARGGTLKLGHGAIGVTEESGKVRVRTAHEELVADRLVVAAGAWSGTIPGLSPLPLKPMRGQMMTIWHPTIRLTRVLSGAGYLAPWRAGEIVVGATEEDVGFACHTSPAGLLYLSAVVQRTTPALAEAKVGTAWAGLRSSTPSGRPLLGPWPGSSRVIVASGHGGQGIMTGGLSGRLAADFCDSGKAPEADPFLPLRAVR